MIRMKSIFSCSELFILLSDTISLASAAWFQITRSFGLVILYLFLLFCLKINTFSTSVIYVFLCLFFIILDISFLWQLIYNVYLWFCHRDVRCRPAWVGEREAPLLAANRNRLSTNLLSLSHIFSHRIYSSPFLQQKKFEISM